MDAVRLLVPMLVMGTKEKNAAVKSYSEHALISLLRLRHDDSTLAVSAFIHFYSLFYSFGLIPSSEMTDNCRIC